MSRKRWIGLGTIIILFLLVSSVHSQEGSESPYQEQLVGNQDFSVASGDSLSANDLQGYSGTVNLGQGSSAQMPANFQGTLILTDAEVEMPGGKIVIGTGRCDSEGCVITQGETGSGDTKVSNGEFHIKTDGTIDISMSATIGEGDLAIDVSNVKNLKFNDDGTSTFEVEEDSIVAGATIGTEGTIVLDPKRNSIKPSAKGGEVFLIKQIDKTVKPIIFERDNVDIQLDKGMYLSKGFTKIVFDEQDCEGNCVFVSDKRIKLSGDDYTIRFGENNPVVNVYQQDELKAEYEKRKRQFFEKYNLPEEKYAEYSFKPSEVPDVEKLGISEQELDRDWNLIGDLVRELQGASVLEISPKGGTVKIENRNVFDRNQILGIDRERTQAPKITITGDESNDVWAELRNGAVILQSGKAGLINPRRPGRRGTEFGIPVELNILDSEGNSLITDKDGKETKISMNTLGTVYFSTANAEVNVGGFPSCESAGGYTIPNCKDDYYQFSREFGSKAALEAAKDEYRANLGRKHDFTPEYAQNLDHIALYSPTGMPPDILETQLEILQQLPDYTQIKLFVDSDSQRERIRTLLPTDVYEKITFVEAPANHQFTMWAQDYTEGDSQVQILPLTYLGGGGRKTPDRPENDLVYQLEETGIEVRKVPIEFAGGNVYVTKDKKGRKILYVGGDSYLATKDSYQKSGDRITEAQYKEIMMNSFNVDRVEIIATRDGVGEIQPQARNTFHIDQIMLPLDDGVVAMPSIELAPPTTTREEIRAQKKKALAELGARYGLEADEYGIINIYSLPENQQGKVEAEEREVTRRFNRMEGAIYDYEQTVEVKKQLDQHRTTLKAQGFEVVELKADSRSVGNFQAYTNGLVYQDRNTGERTVIMPIFPNENGEYKMEGTNLENKKAYERAGYKVKTVKDRAFKQKGNIHCLTILAQAPQTCPTCDLSLG